MHATEVLRPTALIERRQATRRRAQHARDVAVSVAYLTGTHIVAPIVMAALLLGNQWSSRVLIATIPVSVGVAVAFGYRTRKAPCRIVWELPNTLDLPGGQWQFTTRDLTWRFRWWRHHTIWLRTAVAVGGAGVLWATDRLPLAGLLSAVWLWWFLRRLGGARVTYVAPWHVTRIRAGMLQTGIWGPKDLPSFRHTRPIQSNQWGDTVWLNLGGKHHTTVSAKKAQFVAGVGLRDKQVTMSHDDTMPADSIQIRFLNGHPRAPRVHWALAAAEDTT